MDNRPAIFIDPYEHIVSGIYYITTRIDGPGAPSNLYHAFETGCKCTDSGQITSNMNGVCSDKNNSMCCCQPIKRYDCQQVPKRIICIGDSVGPIRECHQNCLCESLLKLKEKDNELNKAHLLAVCENRLVQFGPRAGLEIFSTEEKGLGLRSSSEILKGEFICEYAGEVIGEEEAERRITRNRNLGLMNYVLFVKEHIGNDKIIVTCVDPSMFGNIGRYINHSCTPNAHLIPVRTNSPVPLICVFALKDIKLHEEITFDYGIETEDSPSGTPCLCGSQSCRKWLPGVLSQHPR